MNLKRRPFAYLCAALPAVEAKCRDPLKGVQALSREVEIQLGPQLNPAEDVKSVIIPKAVARFTMHPASSLPRTQAVNADEDLAFDIERVGIHEFAALARIHRRFGGKLSAICLRITGNSESAEDALQEVYIKLWNRAESYDRNLSRPAVWLGTLTRNCAIDLARAQGRRQNASLPVDYDEVDDSPPVDECLIEKERQMKAVELLESLGKDQGELIRDIYLKGLSYADLSEQHGLPIATIKSRIRRGLMAMKKAWRAD